MLYLSIGYQCPVNKTLYRYSGRHFADNFESIFQLRPSSSKNTSVCLSATPSSQCSCHHIIVKFSGVITIDKRDVHAEGQGQRSKVKVTEVKTQFKLFLDRNTSLNSHMFQDRNTSFNSHMTMNKCTKVDVAYERCPIVFKGHLSNFKVTQLKNPRFWPKLGVSRL